MKRRRKAGPARKPLNRRDLFDPYIEGYDAARAGVLCSANPYQDCDAAQLWDQGWGEGATDGKRVGRYGLIQTTFPSRHTAMWLPAVR
jgi:ribosome modulation factor